jgi:RNA recognition motif-containing protein
VNTVQGTLAQRKLKVRGIDSRVVSVQDIKKLFGKCGPLITASFDTNEFGAYLGTATLIYSRAASALRAIKDYNMAQIDNRAMKVEFAMPQQAGPVQPRSNPGAAAPQQNPSGVRRTGGRIGKSGRGRTLNVMRGRN